MKSLKPHFNCFFSPRHYNNGLILGVSPRSSPYSKHKGRSNRASPGTSLVRVRGRGLLPPLNPASANHVFSTRHHTSLECRSTLRRFNKSPFWASILAGFPSLSGLSRMFALTYIFKYYWHSPCLISLHLPCSPFYYSRFPLLPSINQCMMLCSWASCTQPSAPRVTTAKKEKSVLDMYTTCGLLLSLNEVNWDPIHMDSELHKFWLISFEDRGSERQDFVKDDTQTSYYHIHSYRQKYLKWTRQLAFK